MQYHGPDTFIQIKITSKLKADVEAAAVAESQTVNAWITGLLEAAIAQAHKSLPP
jgi:predicted HicB family RNase H-like nuclease